MKQKIKPYKIAKRVFGILSIVFLFVLFSVDIDPLISFGSFLLCFLIWVVLCFKVRELKQEEKEKNEDEDEIEEPIEEIFEVKEKIEDGTIGAETIN